MRKLSGIFIMIFCFAVCFALLGGSAYATSVLDFGVVAPTTGTISYAGGMNPLVGTGISVDNVSGLPGGPTFNVIGGLLNFTTGNLVSSDATNWYFGGGALTTITIVGGVDVNGDGDADDPGDIPLGTTLLTGYFGNAQVTMFGDVFRIAGASFTDTKDPGLLALFNLPADAPFHSGNFNISFNASGAPPNGFQSSMVLSGDVTNQVPEPASLVLIGSGLLGIFAASRFRRRRS